MIYHHAHLQLFIFFSLHFQLVGERKGVKATHKPAALSADVLPTAMSRLSQPDYQLVSMKNLFMLITKVNLQEGAAAKRQVLSLAHTASHICHTCLCPWQCGVVRCVRLLGC